MNLYFRLFVLNCPGCGKDHHVDFTRLDKPKAINGLHYTHKGMCDNSKKELHAFAGVDVAREELNNKGM